MAVSEVPLVAAFREWSNAVDVEAGQVERIRQATDAGMADHVRREEMQVEVDALRADLAAAHRRINFLRGWIFPIVLVLLWLVWKVNTLAAGIVT